MSIESRVASRFKKAAKMDLWREWKNIVEKHEDAEGRDMQALLKELVNYMRSVGYDLDVSKSHLGKEWHGSDRWRLSGQLVITEREENTVKGETPQQVAGWIEEATGIRGTARKLQGYTWMVDISE